ncbi:unnamed protein product [Urochloa decumbens]|uniref:trimethyltridecatetraene synthase n=1 Tax=Urochloa decumbens TaxID=240449 RepID=A0ABC9GDM1_9POAL
MEVTLSLTAATAVALTATTFVVLALSSVVWQWQRRRSQRKPLNLPPGPRGWPVFGSLGLLAGALPPHRVLAALAARHGELMHLRLGSFDLVVASSAETARLVLKTHDLAFVGRPPTAFGEIIEYGYKGILQTPYGPYWRMVRRLCVTELLSPSRIDAFERARTQETRAMARHLFESAGAAVDLKELLLGVTMRNVLRMAVGEKWSRCYGSEEAEAFRQALGEAFAVAGAGVRSAGEWVPWLRWLPQGLLRRMRRVHEVFDPFLEQILAEHERDHREQHGDGGEFVARDLLDVLLQLSQQGQGPEEGEGEQEGGRLTRDGVKAIVTDVLSGGTEPAAATAEWAMAELLRRPDAMSAAADELDRVVGRDRWATERDLPDLPYVNAVVRETMRLHPVGPLLSIRCAREDTVVAVTGASYDVPAGTRMLVNAWAVGRDPAAWPDAPGEFRPERFLAGGAAEGVDPRGAHFQLVPFGAGRRMCPGYGLGMKEVAAMVASMVQGFTWRLPDGVAPEDVTMEECFGLSVSRKVPLVAVAQPRLPAQLYVAVD